MNVKPIIPQIGTFVIHKNKTFKIYDISKNIFGGTLYCLYRPDDYNYNAQLDEIIYWTPKGTSLCWFWNNIKDIPILGFFNYIEDEHYLTIGNQKFLYCEPFLGKLSIPTILQG